ncbi:protein IRX15-LIKE-like [Tasmannia lanceolata]|uniref:protein IRX15-LIKE-like n=1 Tax=Tasmannia lanceolata TaxID=3420 RepID=UPI004062B93F
MKNSTNSAKLILFHHPSLQKQATSHRLWLLIFFSFFTFIFFFTLLTMRETPISYSSSSSFPAKKTPLPAEAITALLHYHSSSNATGRMSSTHLRSISDALRHSSPSNFLIFGLGLETLLYKALNYNGRTVFLDENEYLISKFEEKHPNIEAYDVQFTTKVSQMWELLDSTKEQVHNECRPVQNLLFSDCKLGINDLPNHIYEVDWDVILVDGPRGYSPSSPGRMSAIFTAGVLGRNKKRSGMTHVFVHDFYREVERVFSMEFLCQENMVFSDQIMAHFVVEAMDENTFAFCQNGTASSSS